MDSPRLEEEDEDDTDWMSRGEQEDPTDIPVQQTAASFSRQGTKPDTSSRRVIVHMDMDCFYAQVEMIRNPELKDKPLGVQQKYLMVTCNYVARECGVSKCMSIKEAREKCPQLVLVSGEDLTHYREMSYKVTELLEEFGVKVERLGFDENFVDITELVDKKLQQNGGSLEVSGHVYNNQAVNGSDGTHSRLVAGSHIAAEMRAAVQSRLGLTGCAGIACNKVLSKLVSGTFKPNQQTVLLPESSKQLIDGLNHVKRIPGIGYKTAERLEGLGVSSVCTLQSCPVTVLEAEFGSTMAHRIKQLSRGEDDSLVTPTGPPQSLSEEDSFKKCSTLSEVKIKIEELLRSLLNRLHADGRNAYTLRLTQRQFSSTNRYHNRESRQCPIPKSVVQTPSSESSFSILMDLLMKLFEKMIDVRSPFHLTLLNVCFSNLKPAQSSNSSRNSIGFYLTQKKMASAEASQISKDLGAKPEGDPHETNPSTTLEANYLTTLSLPDHIDMEVFSQLPEDIKKEILSSPQTRTVHKSSKTTRPPPRDHESKTTRPQPSSQGIQSFFMKATTRPPQSSSTAGSSPVAETPTHGQHNKMASGGSCQGNKDGNLGDNAAVASSSSTIPRSDHVSHDVDMDCAESSDGSRVSYFPRSVDMNVFSQLPEELRKELMADWKSKELSPKIPAVRSQEKARNAKGQRPKSSNLLKYFKPG